jgi:hypothetical protein
MYVLKLYLRYITYTINIYICVYIIYVYVCMYIVHTMNLKINIRNLKINISVMKCIYIRILRIM